MTFQTSRIRVLMLLVACSPAMAQPQGPGPGAYAEIARTGGPSPAGGVFEHIYDAPVINNSGNILIPVTYRLPGEAPVYAMLVGKPGELLFAIEQGDGFLGESDDPRFISARKWTLGDDNTVSLAGLITLPSTSRWAVMTGQPGSLRLAARETFAAPGVPSAFVDLSTRAPVNSTGQIAFAGTVSGSKWGVWMTDPAGALQPVAVPQQQATVMGPNWRWDTVYVGPVLSDSGLAACVPIARNTQTNQTESAVVVGNHLGLTLLARRGMPAAGFPAGVTYRSLSGPSISRDGRVIFNGSVFIDGESFPGLWAATEGGGVRAVVVGTEPLPGMPEGSTVAGIMHSSINSAGSVAFVATLDHGGPIDSSNDDALWLERDGVLSIIVSEQDLIPGLGDVHLHFSPLDRYSQLNEAHQIVFRAFIHGEGVTEENDQALLAWDLNSGLQVIAREGTPFEVSPGDVRTVSAVDFVTAYIRAGTPTGPSGTGGTESGLNDHGQVAFTLRFTDGTAGVYLYTIQSCRADWNADQTVNSNDISAYLASWLAGVQDGTLVADFDGSGSVNSNDISAFLAAWLDAVQGGC